MKKNVTSTFSYRVVENQSRVRTILPVHCSGHLTISLCWGTSNVKSDLAKMSKYFLCMLALISCYPYCELATLSQHCGLSFHYPLLSQSYCKEPSITYMFSHLMLYVFAMFLSCIIVLSVNSQCHIQYFKSFLIEKLFH